MKFNRTLLYIALTANLLTILFIVNVMGQPGGTGASMMFMLFWFPGIWIVTVILTIVLTIKNWNDWFYQKRLSTIILLIFCTPIPIMITIATTIKNYGTENGAYRGMSWYRNIGSKRVKMERWQYRSGQIYVDKYFTADSINERTLGEDAFKKDSTWIYLDETGDTLKVEKYKDDRLLN